MKRFWGWTAAAVALLLAAGALSLLLPLGIPLWHYNVAFLATLVAAGAAWRLLQRRRAATLAMAFTGIVATATGFAMLYTRQMPFKEPITWWHSVTSFAFLVAFLVHWLHNHPRLWGFTKRLFTRDRAPGLAATGAWIGILAAGAWTGIPDVRARFTSENYLYLSSWAVLVGVVFAYGLWLAYRLPAMRARLADVDRRNRARGLIDTGLFLANWGALLTGFALLYFADFLRGDSGFKYVSKWWHTAASVALLAFVAIHIGFNARLLAAHARRVDSEL